MAHTVDPNYGPGRPTDYRPEYCDMVMDACREQGFSLTGFAGLIGVSRETIYRWIERHSEFSDACSRARAARVTWWERKLARSRKGAETTASIFALRNADPLEWRDIRHTQTDVNVQVSTLTDAQLFAIASGKSLDEGNVIEGESERVETG